MTAIWWLKFKLIISATGLASIKIAKQNGSWIILNEVEALIVSDDLEAALGFKILLFEFE
jgi:uncharacterized protein YdeI (YjbR/CyaY-like superfamily)